MPGLVGYVTESPQVVDSQQLGEMIRPLWRAAQQQPCVNQSEQAALAGIGVLGERTLSARRGVWLAVAGTVAQQADLKRSLPPDHGPVETLSDLLLELFLASGVCAVQGLNGGYSVAIWEEAPHRLTLLVDRLGTAGLYYWAAKDRLAFASELKAIALRPDFTAGLNQVAVADLFLYRFPVGEHTLFSSIYRLPPAGMLVYEHGRVHLQHYWQPAFNDRAASPRLENDFRAEMAHHLQEAVRRRVQPNSALLLTGGLDSRAVAGFYRQVAPDLPLLATTISRPGSSEERSARSIAGALRIDHQRVPLSEDYIATYAAWATWRGEGRVPAIGGWIYAQEPFLAERGLDFALTGLFGDTITGRHFPGAVVASSLDASGIEAWLQGRMEARLKTLVQIARPDFYQAALKESASTLMRQFRASTAPHPLNRYDDLMLHMLVAAMGQKLDIFGDAAYANDPYLDNDLVAFCLRMPPRFRADMTFFRRLIVEHLPQAARVPHGISGYPLALDLLVTSNRRLKKLDQQGRRVLRRVWPARFDSERIDAIQAETAIRGQSSAFVQQVLMLEDHYADMFDPAGVRRLLADHVEGSCDHSDTISALLTLTLFRQMFTARDLIQPPSELVEETLQRPATFKKHDR